VKKLKAQCYNITHPHRFVLIIIIIIIIIIVGANSILLQIVIIISTLLLFCSANTFTALQLFYQIGSSRGQN
jgi:hypothetical protein